MELSDDNKSNHEVEVEIENVNKDNSPA